MGLGGLDILADLNQLSHAGVGIFGVNIELAIVAIRDFFPLNCLIEICLLTKRTSLRNNE